MPNWFRESYPTTFAIIDATELYCEVPASLSLQSQCYSSYKSHTTMKRLVAIAPNGTIIFISTLYSGSISDQELTIKSGLLELLQIVRKNKSIMADCGFDIQDLLEKSDILLSIPPFKCASHLQKEGRYHHTAYCQSSHSCWASYRPSKTTLSPVARGDSTVNGCLCWPNLDCLLFAH